MQWWQCDKCDGCDTKDFFIPPNPTCTRVVNKIRRPCGSSESVKLCLKLFAIQTLSRISTWHRECSRVFEVILTLFMKDNATKRQHVCKINMWHYLLKNRFLCFPLLMCAA
jgi:hypothetical protein